jgi:hypothetical protein
MAAFSIRFTFSPNTTISSAEVNTNFAELKDFVNGQIVHRDGSTALTGLLLGPAQNPTNDNHLVRKAYVDWMIGTRLSTAARPRGATVYGRTNSSGYLTFDHGIGSKPVSVVASPRFPETGMAILCSVLVTTWNTSTITIRCLSATNAPLANLDVAASWIAVMGA